MSVLLQTVNRNVELMWKAEMTAMLCFAREDTNCLTIALIIQKACQKQWNLNITTL